MEPDTEIEYVKLLTDHQTVIRSFVISLLPGAPGVDDVIQETNKVLWMKRLEFEIGSNFRAWCLRIARFQVMAHLQMLKRRRWVTLDDDVAELLAEDLEGSTDAELRELRLTALGVCIQRVRPSDYELLMQRYWHKTRLQDFAVLRNSSFSGLKVQLFRLRAALKRCIDQHVRENLGI